MKCITCDSSEAVIHGQCQNCFTDHIQITTNSSLEVTICPKCGAFKIGNSWSRGKIERPISKKISSHILLNDPNVSTRILSDSIQLQRLENRITFSTELLTGGEKISDKEAEIPARILLNSCPTCNKITGSYYEAIIQLRTLTSESTSIVNKVLGEITPILEKLHTSENDSFVSSIKPVKGGIDIYLGKKNDGIKVSKYIHDHYFSDTTTTKKLAGRREGSDFYRHTFLVRLFNLEPGAVLWDKDRAYILEKVRANALTVIDSGSERRRDILQNDFIAGSYSHTEETAESRNFLVVSTTDNESMVMDKENFQVITLKGHFEGEIRAFKYRGKVIVANS